ncbi:MAG TPA: cyclic pyranopterin monophosphate synthase MoaC [Pirellulaceae bacterium]
MAELTHFDRDGSARMVDVGSKPITDRLARAIGLVSMKLDTLERIRQGQVGKGDVLGIARIAGIQAAKRTGDLIPLCHPLNLDAVDITFRYRDDSTLEIEAAVRVQARTGVEMEALTAVSVAALTVYDMCKSLDRDMSIRSVQLVEKRGGVSGEFSRTSASD